jgi:hypothetical protein
MFKEKREKRMRNGRVSAKGENFVSLKAKGGIFNVHGPLLEG